MNTRFRESEAKHKERETHRRGKVGMDERVVNGHHTDPVYVQSSPLETSFFLTITPTWRLAKTQGRREIVFGVQIDPCTFRSPSDVSKIIFDGLLHNEKDVNGLIKCLYF